MSVESSGVSGVPPEGDMTRGRDDARVPELLVVVVVALDAGVCTMRELGSQSLEVEPASAVVNVVGPVNVAGLLLID